MFLLLFLNQVNQRSVSGICEVKIIKQSSAEGWQVINDKAYELLVEVGRTFGEGREFNRALLFWELVCEEINRQIEQINTQRRIGKNRIRRIEYYEEEELNK